MLTPPESDRVELHRVIYDELCLGTIVPASRASLRRMAAELVARSAAAYVSGVPEEPADDGFFGPASVTWRVSADLDGGPSTITPSRA